MPLLCIDTIALDQFQNTSEIKFTLSGARCPFLLLIKPFWIRGRLVNQILEEYRRSPRQVAAFRSRDGCYCIHSACPFHPSNWVDCCIFCRRYCVVPCHYKYCRWTVTVALTSPSPSAGSHSRPSSHYVVRGRHWWRRTRCSTTITAWPADGAGHFDLCCWGALLLGDLETE